TNSAGSWAAANSGLTNLVIQSLAINATTPATLYAGTLGGGIFISTDAAGGWTAMNSGITNPALRVDALAVDPTGGSTLYAGLESGSVWQFSVDVGTAPAITTQPT